MKRVLWRQLSIIRSSRGSLAEMCALVRLVAATGLRPILDETYPPSETRVALERMQAGQHTGKIVIEL